MIDKNGDENDIVAFFGGSCKCLSIMISSNEVTIPVDPTWDAPSFFGLSFAEIEAKIEINILFQKESKSK